MLTELPNQVDPMFNKFKCYNCPKLFKSKKMLIEHLVKFECIKGVVFDYQCKFCKHVFFQKKGLEYHTNHNVCKLVNLEELNIDQKLIKPKYKKFKCEVCEFEFKRKYLLQQHICVKIEDIFDIIESLPIIELPDSINNIIIDQSIFNELKL